MPPTPCHLGRLYLESLGPPAPLLLGQGAIFAPGTQMAAVTACNSSTPSRGRFREEQGAEEEGMGLQRVRRVTPGCLPGLALSQVPRAQL